MPKKKSKAKLKSSLKHVLRRVFSENPASSLNHRQVCSLIDVREKALRKLVFHVLEELKEEGYLASPGHGVYALNQDGNFIEGILQMTPRGAGYVVSDQSDTDIFIPPHQVQQSLDGDRVKVQITKRGKSKIEGVIVDVLDRERTQFVGTIQASGDFAFLIPDNSRVGTDIFIPKERLKKAKDGDKALVKITKWPKSADNPYGEVIEVLGKDNSNDLEMISILVNQGLEYRFPDVVMSEAEQVEMDLDEKEIARRRDMRLILTFTIDPEDAKDFDDALSFRRLKNGNIEVGVHIADVSHYVQPGSAMDEEAYKRSNSVYLVDRVIPMLPEQLSNMACSLRPNEDKYAFSAVFEMDENGKIYKEWFGKTVIHSNRRFTYEEAQEVIESGKGDCKDEILLLDKIAKTYRKRRLKAGAMNIESEEIRFRLDEEGFPSELMIKRSKDAHKLIEEFMLLANRLVATYIADRKDQPEIPFVFRCHDDPDPERVALFNMFIGKFGYDIDVTDPKNISKNINSLLKDIRYKNEYSIIQSMAIRSMAKASYETNNIGHYGLSFKHYTHFTSPIRRYADLLVHRILFENLNKDKHRYSQDLSEMCKRISRQERKAIDAERESTKFFQTLFVIDKVGQEFDGVISGLAEFGVFVKMNENQCEGLVPMQEIPGDRFRFDQDSYSVIGAKTKKMYNFGDPVRVRIYEVSTRKRTIDLEMIAD